MAPNYTRYSTEPVNNGLLGLGGGYDHSSDDGKDSNASHISGHGAFPGLAATASRRRHRRSRTPKSIAWRYPALAVGLFVASLLFAVGHDLYYKSLDGKLADGDDPSTTSSTTTPTSTSGSMFRLIGSAPFSSTSQTWAIRIGTGLAILHKTALVAVVGMVGAQQVWVTLRRKAMTIGGIDSLFSVLDNPLALWSRDLLAHAKMLVLLAMVAWLLPLVAVVTPATLTVQSRPLASVARLDVPTTNFFDATQWVSAGGAGYIVGASFAIATLFSNVYSSAGIVHAAAGPPPPASPNSSYEQIFYGPSYKCISLADALNANYPATWLLDNPINEANTTYKTFADVFYGELGLPHTSDPAREAISVYAAAAPSYLFNMILISASGTNPLWDGGVFPSNISSTSGSTNGSKGSESSESSESSNSNSNSTFESPPGSNLVCQLYNTSFHISKRFVNGVQTAVPLDIEYLEPQSWDDSAGKYALLDPCSGVQGDPDTAPNNSSRGACHNATATFYVTHRLFSYLLASTLRAGASGTVTVVSGPGTNAATSPLLQSPLMHCPDVYNSSQFLNSDAISSADEMKPALYCRNGTLAAAIEDLSRNFTLSTLTFGGWANHTDRVAVTSTADRLFFAYGASTRRTLWAAYGSALGAVLAVLVLGAWALWRNGVVSSTSFATALLTTRNPGLTGLLHVQSDDNTRTGAEADVNTVYRRSLGSLPVDSRVQKLRLRFGYIDNNDGGLAGFGLDGTVKPLPD
ncbi:hypothetical protein SPI_06087 [Niveomyces insectorum RCEF 264]|uniref:Formylmethionine deformylase-like protein n=1 Tax=Niveomyces insectorum RCEF 264 TaxID=1081102 RepID=A0A167SSJ4_9HYPO|nr:hypothetical protein SPI_06087 [Niveomyces insectorum RCEF 264]